MAPTGSVWVQVLRRNGHCSSTTAVSSCIKGYHAENLQCSQWRQCRHYLPAPVNKTFALFNSLGKIPVTKDRLHICTRGTVIDSFICLIIDDFKPSHPAALSFSEPMILHIPFSVTGSESISLICFYVSCRRKHFHRYCFSSISFTIY